MAASVETSTFNAEKPMSRKRKQDYASDATSKTSSLWSDYVCSSPSSPATTLGMQHQHGDAMAVDTTSFATATSSAQALDLNNLDAMFAAHGANQFDHSFDFYNFDTTTTHLPTSGSASRRHSVAVGELDFHSFDATRNTFDMQHFDNEMQRLLAMPSSCSPSTSSGTSTDTVTTSGVSDPVMPQQATHKRTASLRLETSLPMQHESTGVASPSTPAFFSPGFLEALYSDEDKNTSFLLSGDPNASFTPPMPLTSTPDQQQQPMMPISSSAPASSNHHDFLLQHHAVTTHAATEATIAPSAISNSDMHAGVTPWMMNHQQQQQHHHHHQEPVYHQKQSQRSSCMRSSPPGSPSNTSTMSSSSPSPPITPMQPGYGNGYDNGFKQPQLQHATIPEEDEEMAIDRQNVASMATWTAEQQQRFRASKSSLVTARMLQGANTASVLKPHIQQYLMSSNPAGSGERTVMILTSKVAQKSYGTEKRFLCPPPTTVLSGASWWTSDPSTVGNDKDNSFLHHHSNAAATSTTLSPPKLTVHISGETTSQSGVVEWHAPNGSILDASSAASAASNAAMSSDTTLSGKCVSKHLHINDADEKRKRVEVLVKMQLGNGLQLGTLASKGIKVISKPSKKRQSVKNMELCIHHGTTISLFNRIRSQTVSTKYLGVSTSEQQQGGKGATPGNGTCFVARTGSWDPFVIWIVDTSRAPDMTATTSRKHHPNNPNYPPPPAIALQTDPAQHPLAIHYNQAVVLQCVSTGLVSPVMVIRKVDKGSMVLGGNHLDDLSGTTGGECGDEALGDPVSQLHKIAFQIVQDPSIAHSNKAGFHPHTMDPSAMANEWTLPQSCQPITYLACLNDVVGMHKTTTQRMFVSQRNPAAAKDWMMGQMMGNNGDFMVARESDRGGKVVRKRRVSCDVVKPMSLPAKLQNMSQHRRRVNSLNDVPALHHRRGSTSALLDRRGSTDSNSNLSDGACWTEDVSDAAVWTIVGTDCATYTFWTPPPMLDTATSDATFNSPFTSTSIPPSAAAAAASPITPFPVISHIPQSSAAGGDSLSISGENLTRDLAVWFGDVKCPRTDYRSRESISCSIPDLSELVRSPVITVDEENGSRKLPILLVRGDGVVYRTGKFYTF